MTNQEKANYIDAFLLGLTEVSFPSTLAAILEFSQLPSEENKDKFKLIEFDLERLGLVQFVRGRDNSTLDGQCEYFISGKGLKYVNSSKSTIELFIKENVQTMKINWTRAYNRLFAIIDHPTEYLSGSKFLNVAREVDYSIPSYNKYIEQRRENNESTTRRDFFGDVIEAMTEEQKLELFQNMIEDFEPRNPEGLDNLKAVFKNYNSNGVIKKKTVPTVEFPNAMYVDVLQTLHNFYRNIEQKPSLYRGKGEEDLRDYALTFLESRYEKAVASGETFNKAGKTDIILKSADGCNLFVAECKIWHGADQFHQAIEQLFGYLTWRDTKASLIFFVRNKRFGDVLDKIKEEAAKNQYFAEYTVDRQETSFSFRFRHKEDPARIVLVEIMAFSFPDK